MRVGVLGLTFYKSTWNMQPIYFRDLMYFWVQPEIKLSGIWIHLLGVEREKWVSHDRMEPSKEDLRIAIAAVRLAHIALKYLIWFVVFVGGTMEHKDIFEIIIWFVNTMRLIRKKKKKKLWKRGEGEKQTLIFFGIMCTSAPVNQECAITK